MSAKPGGLHLGEVVDPASGERTGEPVVVPAHHLTTHGVIVGMTGSGRTDDIETMEIDLEKDDIALDEVVLVWIPR